MSGVAPPRSLDAPKDAEIRGAPLAVYFWLLGSGKLGFVEFRPLKSLEVAQAMDLNERTARFCLRQLVRSGYLEQGPREHANDVGTYRLVWESGPALPHSSAVAVARRVG